MKRITIDLPDEIYQELKIRCATANISMSDVVRKLLEKILKGISMDRDFLESMKKRNTRELKQEKRKAAHRLTDANEIEEKQKSERVKSLEGLKKNSKNL